MEQPTNISPTPPKRGRWLRVVACILGIFVILLVVAYFIGTSSAFFKGVILPRISRSIHANVTVADASISPFSEVVLHNLRVQASGEEPLVTATEVRARYSLMDILHGNIHVDEVTLSSATVVIVENPDGTRNYDPLLKAQNEKTKETKPSEPPTPAKPMQLDLKKIALTDATVRQIKRYKNGNQDVMELAHVDVTAEGVKNGQSGKLAVKAEIKVENHPPPPGTNGLFQAKLMGNFAFTLSSDLKPSSIQGKARLDIAQAVGGMADLAALGADLDCDVTPTDIKQVALRFQKSTTQLGQVLVSGPFDLAKGEGRVSVQILSIDKQVLNLAGAKSGIDFGTTTLNSSNEIQLAKSGAAITASGRLELNKVQATRAQQTLPPLELRAEYSVTVDRAAQSALLHSLTLLGTEKGNPLLRAELTSPMTVAWGNVTNAVGDSALNLTVTHLNLADWKPFIGDFAAAGDANLKLTLLSQQAGKKLTFDLDSHTDNLTAGTGTNQITQASVVVQARGQATDLRQFSLTDYKLQVSRQNEPIVSAIGRRYDSLVTITNASWNPLDDFIGLETVKGWREGVWRNAERLLDAKTPAERRQVSDSIEANAATWANLIAAGQVPGYRAQRDAYCAQKLG